MKESKSGQLLAAGRTGRSVQRMEIADLAALGRYHALQNASLSKLNTQVNLGERQLFEKVKNAHNDERAQVAMTYQNPVLSKSPQMINETWAAVTEGLDLASSVVGLATGLGPAKTSLTEFFS